MSLNEQLAFAIVLIILIIVGVVLIKFPQGIRKYDRGLTRYIKSEQEYSSALRWLGIIFILFSSFFLIMGLFFPQFLKTGK